ncbi:MAG: oligosaccharide flippase family protein [Candidatus Thermoplasmatota archaeon]|nr:oligosaccharide flippase family protein [Candidatus Thermoplasmatota archaeon]
MLSRKFTLIFTVNILNGLLGYVAVFFIARYMGPVPLGIIGFALGFIGLFSFLADPGIGLAHTKRVSEGKDLATCIGTFLTIKIILTGIMILCIFGAVAFWKFGLGMGFESIEQEIALYIMVIYFAFTSISLTFTSTFDARLETAKSQSSQLVATIARMMCVVVVALIGFGTIGLAWAYVCGSIAMLSYALFLFRSYPIGKFSKDYLKSYFHFALPAFLGIVVGVIAVNIDSVMIQLFYGSTDVGYYSGARRISEFLLLFSGATGLLLFPAMSGFHAKNNIAELRNLTHRSERYLSMIVSPITVFTIILAYPIVHVLLSDQFFPSATLLRLLAVFVFIITLSHPYTVQFSSINKPIISAKIGALSAILNICLNLIFIPQSVFGFRFLGWGARGAAFATIIAAFAGFCLTRIIVKRLTSTKSNPRILLHFIAAFVMGAFLILLNAIIYAERWYHLVLFALAGFGIYFSVLYLLNEFKKEDYRLFTETLNPIKMIKYIKRELKD